MTLKVPNKEQELAIRHRGGVLLSAGAGAGKTFVLVEHIKHLVEQCLKINQGCNPIDLARKIKNDFSGMVLMTFTNKAAGELEVKLHKLISEHAQSGQDPIFIDSFKLAAESILITTIHGFCHKLLRSGMITDASCEFDIVGDYELECKIKKYFNKWIENLMFDSSEIAKVIFWHRLEVEQVLCNIFKSPELRIVWEKIDFTDASSWEIKDYLAECLKLLGVLDLKNKSFDLGAYVKREGTSWYKLIKRFEEIKKFDFSLDTILETCEFFEQYYVKMPTIPQSSVEVVEWVKKLKCYRDFLKKNQDDFVAYFQQVDGHFTKWLGYIKNGFDYVCSCYDLDNQRTFSDLEYYVYKGLSNETNLKQISSRYKYFIIDEFQDTSRIQFSIIESIIQHDFNRLFAVGDPKQAIYGFRGGELQVFTDCSLRVLSNLKLKNNYRSKAEIINFNNTLFAYLFKKNKEFAGVDDTAVSFFDQVIPPGNLSDSGFVNISNVEIKKTDDNELISDEHLSNIVEAQYILERILHLKLAYPEDKICVLYKKLSPSKYLISKLVDVNIGHSAQMKISQDNDIIYGLFTLFVKVANEQRVTGSYGTIEAYFKLVLECYLKHLNIVIAFDANELAQSFIQNLGLMCAVDAFKKVLFDLGIANSNYKNNFKNIESATREAGNDLEKLCLILEDKEAEKFTMVFQTGESSGNVQIMTGHSSKGLEFDHIILAGIHTNGKIVVDHSFVGKIPGSIKWKSTNEQETPYLSPNKIYERLLNEKIEFSESKRLFYVAFTRAIKSINWVSLSIDGNDFIKSKSSWIQGLRNFESELCDRFNSFNFIQMHENIFVNERHLQNSKVLPPAFYMRDPMGVVKKEICKKEKVGLGLISELSVTRFSSIASCPRKFYLQNICKLDESDLDFEPNKAELIEKDIEVNDELGIISSAKRGSKIHAFISQAINNNFILENVHNDLSSNEIHAIEWSLDMIKTKYPQNIYISEEPIKFSLFGYMLSGVIDLQIFKSTETAKFSIWDFKTGPRKADNEEAYRCQVISYAMAMYNLNRATNDQIACLVIAYVDERELIEFEMNFSEIEAYLFDQWVKLSNLNRINARHCNYCKFNNLCSTSCTP